MVIAVGTGVVLKKQLVRVLRVRADAGEEEARVVKLVVREDDNGRGGRRGGGLASVGRDFVGGGGRGGAIRSDGEVGSDFTEPFLVQALGILSHLAEAFRNALGLIVKDAALRLINEHPAPLLEV